ncbi:MAG: hypothetical protein ACTTKF_08075 [Bacteroides sp.]
MVGFRGPVGAQHATPSPQGGVDVIFSSPAHCAYWAARSYI